MTMMSSKLLALITVVGGSIGIVNLTFQTSEPSRGPLAPGDEAATFHFADPELTAELVAAEPDVVSPVAFAWDAAGRMYVAEMNDYPLGPTVGRIRLLEDRDGDGRYERSTVFAEGLSFPNSVLPLRDGVLVTAAPDLLFLRDANGDGRADARTVVYTGFAEGNQQLRANGLTWGLDNWIYGANGRSDGAVRRPREPPQRAVSIHTRDFRFRPDFSRFESLPGQSQFGTAKDDWGNRFLSWNTIPIRHALLDDAVVARNPRLATEAVRDVADPADTGAVYPRSPRPETFNNERTDYYNATCGLTIHRGGALGESYRGNAFVGESLTSLVHRRVLTADGPTFVSRRGEEGQEFLAAEDAWFHPVYFATGPDGALYIADFYRRWVEHPHYVADESQRQRVDWREGEGHGRIWRIRRRDGAGLTPPPRLTKASATELIQALAHDNGWVRDTAQRLLVERKDPAAIDALIETVSHGSTPQERVHALYALAGLDALNFDRPWDDWLDDSHPQVRCHAWRLSAAHVSAEATWRRLRDHVEHEQNAAVRFEQALLLGRLQGDDKPVLLAALASQAPTDRWVNLAVSGGIVDCAGAFLRTLDWLRGDRGQPLDADQLALVQDAARMAGGDDPRVAENDCFTILTSDDQAAAPEARLAVLIGFAEGLSERGVSLRDHLQNADSGTSQVGKLLAVARDASLNESTPLPHRLLALQAVARLDSPTAVRALVALLEPTQHPRLQSAAATALCDAADAELAAELFTGWNRYSTATRQTLAAASLRSAATAQELVAAVERGDIPDVEIDNNVRHALCRHPDTALQARATDVFAGSVPAERATVLEKYAKSLKLAGDAGHGLELFKKHCATCHVLRGLGQRVGPDLSGISRRPKENLLIDLLDPSREVAPNYRGYTAVTHDGRLFTGLVAADTPAVVVIRRAEGAEDTLRRDQIESLHAGGASLMPEGFEQQLNEQDVADVFELLAAGTNSLGN